MADAKAQINELNDLIASISGANKRASLADAETGTSHPAEATQNPKPNTGPITADNEQKAREFPGMSVEDAPAPNNDKGNNPTVALTDTELATENGQAPKQTYDEDPGTSHPAKAASFILAEQVVMDPTPASIINGIAEYTMGKSASAKATREQKEQATFAETREFIEGAVKGAALLGHLVADFLEGAEASVQLKQAMAEEGLGGEELEGDGMDYSPEELEGMGDEEMGMGGAEEVSMEELLEAAAAEGIPEEELIAALAEQEGMGGGVEEEALGDEAAAAEAIAGDAGVGGEEIPPELLAALAEEGEMGGSEEAPVGDEGTDEELMEVAAAYLKKAGFDSDVLETLIADSRELQELKEKQAAEKASEDQAMKVARALQSLAAKKKSQATA